MFATSKFCWICWDRRLREPQLPELGCAFVALPSVFVCSNALPRNGPGRAGLRGIGGRGSRDIKGTFFEVAGRTKAWRIRSCETAPPGSRSRSRAAQNRRAVGTIPRSCSTRETPPCPNATGFRHPGRLDTAHGDPARATRRRGRRNQPRQEAEPHGVILTLPPRNRCQHSVLARRMLHKNRVRCARNAPKRGFDESVVEPLRQRQL
jgi:hypothetical protein